VMLKSWLGSYTNYFIISGPSISGNTHNISGNNISVKHFQGILAALLFAT